MSATEASAANPNPKIVQLIAHELGVRPQQVEAAVALLDEGATVPFIARYRKEATGNLDDTQLRALEERLFYLRELEERRAAVLASIEEQGKLTDELKKSIEAATTKQEVEDLYLPYKPKRRTKAQIAKEAGLEPLADALFGDPTLDPQIEAAKYVNGKPAAEGGVPDVKAALDGARDILAERFAETAELLAKLRALMWEQGVVKSKVVEGKETAEEEKFRDYYDYSETIRTIPSHRALALFRGRNLGVLALNLQLPDEMEEQVPHPCESSIAAHFGVENLGRAGDKWLADVVRWTWRVKASLHISSELMMQLRESAEGEAIRVFGRNLRELLLAAPAGPKAVLGIDPGIRTGCKIAVVDATGKLLETATIYPHEPRRDWNGSLETIAKLAVKHSVQLIAVGNGTASRETDKLATEAIKLAQSRNAEQKLTKVMVSEAGASVYSASELAAKEFPGLDVSLRGAVSIARRLQDPLAELVKIEPKAIGVGQYQHDVNQRALARALDATVEDCVNAVGVDVNTASAPLLARISGLNTVLAKNIVEYRDANGAFPNRGALTKIPRLGAKTFEQAAGFLRINDGDNPLDRSSVHPEAYPVVERILARLAKPLSEVMGRGEVLRNVAASEFTDEKFGVPTVRDILAELEKPGRDPRPAFKTATFREGIEKVSDLQPGMMLEGVVTNVAAFGAFVDIGVHQDGLVHVSALANRFVKDPHQVVKPGQIVKVKVVEVDVKRQRIALTMKLEDAQAPKSSGRASPNREPGGKPAPRGRDTRGGQSRPQPQRELTGAMALAFAKLKK
jgi:protein Tex